eukprot:GHVL01040296.1.p1 GENE.GHVL01040296.1~~GHVL01040296.1.p1  ORF type:complete len:183 (+),score=46.53 GHVL01040296.1:42-551(+)
MLEYNCLMNNIYDNIYRNDRIMWYKLIDMDRKKQRILRELCIWMNSLPFELNKKTNMKLQASADVFQLDCFNENKSFYRKHRDGGHGIHNNGRFVTCIYFPNPNDWSEQDGGYIRILSTHENQELSPQPLIAPKHDRLVLLRCRDVLYEVLETFRKRFSVKLYLTSPQE